MLEGTGDAVEESTPPWARHLPGGTSPEDVDLLAQVSLPAAWAARWRAAPERRIVRDLDGTWLDGGDLLSRTASVAGRLAAAGLRAGDRILLSGDASGAFLVAHCAAMRAGFVVVPVNSAATRRELEALVAAAGARAAVLDATALRTWALEIDPTLLVVSTEVDLPDGPPPPLDVVESGDPALLPYTSGTTGSPKGVPLSHGNLLASAEALHLAWRWSEDDTLILCLPLFHVHGLAVGLHGALLTGGALLLQRGFDTEAVLTAAADATLLFGVPTMYSRLAVADGADRMASLRLCVSGSAPMSAGLHAQVLASCGQVVLERYGMTETIMLVSNPYEGERRAGSVGLPLPGVGLRLGSGDEIEVRGPNVFSGYLGVASADDRAFTEDGWFRTGDIGALDPDGYVRIVGRAKELVITGGYNVHPREVEDVLRTHPDVVDVAIVGTPSPEWGETVTAYVEAGEDLDGDALIAWARGQLVSYKCPRIVHRIDALPRNGMGKVVRGDLRPPSELVPEGGSDATP